MIRKFLAGATTVALTFDGVRAGSGRRSWPSRRRRRRTTSSSPRAASTATPGCGPRRTARAWARESWILRGQVFELDSTGKAGADGMPAQLHDPRRHAARATRRNLHRRAAARRAGRARWTRAARPTRRRRSTPRRAGRSTTRPGSSSACSRARTRRMNAAARRQGARREANYPDGRQRREARQEVTAWAITGVSNSPIPIWADANGKFFGFVFFLSWLPEEYAGEHVRLNEAQSQGAWPAQAPALAKSLVKTPAGAGGVHERARVRRGREEVPGRSDRGRRQGQDHRRRARGDHASRPARR